MEYLDLNRYNVSLVWKYDHEAETHTSQLETTPSETGLHVLAFDAITKLKLLEDMLQLAYAEAHGSDNIVGLHCDSDYEAWRSDLKSKLLEYYRN